MQEFRRNYLGVEISDVPLLAPPFSLPLRSGEPKSLGLREVCLGLVFLTFAFIRDTTVMVRSRTLGIEPDGFGEIGDGPIVVARLLVDRTTATVCSRTFWIDPNGLGEVGDRLVVVAPPLVAHAPAVKGGGESGIERTVSVKSAMALSYSPLLW